MRYQGDEVVVTEAELRWQFWRHYSLMGFVGVGSVWNNLPHFDGTSTINHRRRWLSLRDRASSASTSAWKVGSAWARP